MIPKDVHVPILRMRESITLYDEIYFVNVIELKKLR